MTKSQQAIANYEAGAIQHIPYCTGDDIAQAISVSTATVSRFWRTIGYPNLKAFKKHLLHNEHATPVRKMKRILSELEHEEADIVTEMVDIALANIEETGERVERKLFEPVEAIDRAETLTYSVGALRFA